METQSILINLDIPSFRIWNKHSILKIHTQISRLSRFVCEKKVLTALLSWARFNFFISSWASARFSSLPLALREVIGVESPLPFGVEWPLVDDGLGVENPETFSAFLAAFSASRFCFDAEGMAMTL